MKIGIIGAGIFGITIANRLSKSHEVEIIEKNEDILMASSDVNQCRVHRGYHYPRSDITVKEVLESQESFKEEYKDAIINDFENYYCISKKNSKTSADEYLKFCKRNNLEYKISKLNIINENSINLCVKVKENLFDHKKIKKICWKKLKENNIIVHLNQKANELTFKKYDKIIICTYADTNEFLDKFSNNKLEAQFEICEKIFVKLPKSFDNKSILIMDGPFMSIDPVGDTGIFIIGDVVNTVLTSNKGTKPIIDKKFLNVLNKGIISNPPFTNFKLFINSAEKFMPDVNKAKHVGSSFCIKTVLSNVEKTDERPTRVREINDKIISVFSGKIPTCVDAAKKVEKIIEKNSCVGFLK
jgi:hypothetical protein